MKIRNELKAGIFIAVSLALVAILIMVMGKERQIFASQVEFYTDFRDVKGLAVGAPVRMGGIPIGRVAKVGFTEDLQDVRIHVNLLINEDFLDRMRQDSTVSIETQGLLGDRIVTISPGGKGPTLPPRSRMSSNEIADFAEILNRAQTAVENTSQISERINKSLEGLKPETISDIGVATESLARIFKSIEKEEGFIHRLIYSEKDGARMVESLSKASQDVASLIGEVKTGKGVLNALIYSNSGGETINSFTKAAANIGKASDELAGLMSVAKDGKGLLHDLLYTEVESGSVAKRADAAIAALAATIDNLRVASEALSKGTGTLGALIVDPQLYDNLVEVTDGAKRSFLLRQAIRSSLKQ